MTVAALDCAVDENYPICIEYGVSSTPTLKLFSVNSNISDLGVKLKHDYDEDYTRHLIVQHLVEEYDEGRGGDGWPNLSLYK